MKKDALYYSLCNFSIGTLLIAVSEENVCYLGLPNTDKQTFMRWAKKYYYQPVVAHNQPLIKEVIKELDEYVKHKRKAFTLSFHLLGTPFQKKVWGTISKIPYGQTRSYKDIAHSIGKPNAVRAVGTACGVNPVPLLIPCHRVVKSDGTLGNYGGGFVLKKKLLILET